MTSNGESRSFPIRAFGFADLISDKADGYSSSGVSSAAKIG